MKRARLLWLTIGLTCVVIISISAYMAVASFVKQNLTRDAVFVISASHMYYNLLPAEITPAMIHQLIVRLQQASVIEIPSNDSGVPVDWWGTPFEVVVTREFEEVSVTARSAGPDRKLSTSDDIVKTHTKQFVGEIEGRARTLAALIKVGSSKGEIEKLVGDVKDKEDVAWGESGNHTLYFYLGGNCQIRVDLDNMDRVSSPPALMWTPIWRRDEGGKLIPIIHR